MIVSTMGARHLLFRLGGPARLPDALHAVLRDEVVLTGWMHASGMLSDVQLRAGASSTGAPPRKLSGQVQVIALEGSIGLSGGDVSCGLRAVLARETESGLETISGDIVSAQIETLEVWVTAFDDVTATRQQDRAGVWVLDVTESAGRIAPPPAARGEDMRTAVTSPAPPTGSNTSGAPAPVFINSPSPPPTPPMPSPMQSGFAEVSRAAVVEPPKSAAPPAPPAPQRPSPTFSASAAMPQRIAKPIMPETEDDPVPEPGDTVEHFAFGRCEVLKSEDDRLHVRLSKDQRIKEIALEMLKVSPLPSDEGQTTRHWRLARKL